MRINTLMWLRFLKVKLRVSKVHLGICNDTHAGLKYLYNMVFINVCSQDFRLLLNVVICNVLQLFWRAMCHFPSFLNEGLSNVPCF